MEHLLSTLQYWQLTRHVLLSMLRPTSGDPSRVGLLASGAPCCSSEAPIFLSSGNSLSLAEPKRPFWHRLQQNTSLWRVPGSELNFVQEHWWFCVVALRKDDIP